MNAVPSQMPAPTYVAAGTDITLSWNEPLPLPGEILRYDVISTSIDGNITTIYSGLNTTIIVLLYNSTVDLRVRAVTTVGAGPFSDIATQQQFGSFSNTRALSKPEFYASITVGGLALIVAVALVIHFTRRESERAEEFTKPTADVWEYDPNKLVFGRKLGEGNFGVVFAATAMDICTDMPGVISVAVKKLSGKATDQEKLDFVAEADLMKMVSRPWHPNVCRFPSQGVFDLI